MNLDNMFALHTPAPAQKRHMNLLRNGARLVGREIQSATPAGPNHTLAIRHVADALMHGNLATVQDAQAGLRKKKLRWNLSMGIYLGLLGAKTETSR